MNKKKLALLESVFNLEVTSALTKCPHVYQTKSKLAAELAGEGYLLTTTIRWNGILVEGYELTHLGRMTYCETCTDEGVQ